MSIAVTRTKLHIPRRRGDLLSRSRLISALADLLDYPFTLISAPAGYGKTCLMIDLAHQASHPVCWYSIDPLDKDPKRFLAHLIQAIKEEFPGFGKPSLDLLENLNDPLSSPDQFASTLVNDIYDSISENFAIFLDDYHLLDDHPQIDGFISCFGQLMDENTHLVMSSRRLFSFPDLPLLIGRKQVKGVDQNDLAFQPHELQEYFQSSFQQPLSEKESADMVKTTSGWITGLLLSRESMLPGQNKAARVSGADINSYFGDQVFLKQQEPIRKLMLQTSLFDAFNPVFCEEVLGKAESISYAEFIKILTEQNLFVEQVEDNGIWVRYHHLFRDFLNLELEKQLPGEKQLLLGRLAEYYLGAEKWENAFDAARLLNDPLLMGEVINTAYSPLFHAGRIKLLSDWLEVLPEEGYLTFPLLYSLKGFSLTELGKPLDGFLELDKAINLDPIKSNPNLKAISLIWRSTSNRFIGNYNEGITDSSKAIELISDKSDLRRIKPEAYREIGLSYGRLGNNSEALKFLRRSFDEYKKENREYNVAQVQMDIGLVLLNLGKFQCSRDNLKSTIPQWKERGNNTQLAILMNNLGYLTTLTGNYSDADDWIKQGEECANLSSSRRIQAYLSASRGDLYKSIGFFNMSLDCYRDAEILIEGIQDLSFTNYLPIAKAASFRHLKNMAKAETLLKKHRESIFQGLSQFERGLWHLEWGFIHLAQSELSIALDSFQSARDIFKESTRPFELTRSLLGLILTTHKQGETRIKNQTIQELANRLSELETLQPLLPEFSHHLEDIDQLAFDEEGLEVFQSFREEINQYLKGLPKIQAKLFPRVDPEIDKSGLEIRAFGENSVRQDGKRITASEWIHQRTVREIFFFLLSHPRGVTKGQVGLTFWPDSSPSQLSCQFKNAMYRLRRALGKEAISFHQETRSYSFNRDCRYEYDVERFQEALGLAENHSDQDRKVEQLRQAAALYKHPFAPQLGGTWAEPLRRKLYIDYEKAQLEIAAYELQSGNFTACRDACLAVLELEPCQEKAYQLCMRAYSGLSNLTDLHRIFIRCKDNFNTHLGIRPSNITFNLYKDLTSS